MKKNVFLLAFLGLGFSGVASAVCTGAGTAASAQYLPNAGVGSQAAPAMAADTCLCDAFAGRVSLNGGSGQLVAAGLGGYMRVGIVLQCSANTMVSFTDSAAVPGVSVAGVAMAGTSTRGNVMYVSNTGAAGGAASPDLSNGACTGGVNAAQRTCSAGDVTRAVAGQVAASIAP